MKSISKFVSFIVVLTLLLMPLSPSALAASPDLCQHEHTSCGECYEHDASTSVTAYSQGNAETKNILCSIFGHKLTAYVSYVLGAYMIDMQQCEIYYEDAGYCDRCSEYVVYLRSVVVDHNIRTSGMRTYCTYNCGYELWHVR